VGWRRVFVGEVNAFGDLLPRLTGLPGSGAEGLDTCAAQVAAAVRSTSGSALPNPTGSALPNPTGSALPSPTGSALHSPTGAGPLHPYRTGTPHA
jgi:hypothetical protein